MQQAQADLQAEKQVSTAFSSACSIAAATVADVSLLVVSIPSVHLQQRTQPDLTPRAPFLSMKTPSLPTDLEPTVSSTLAAFFSPQALVASVNVGCSSPVGHLIVHAFQYFQRVGAGEQQAVVEALLETYARDADLLTSRQWQSLGRKYPVLRAKRLETDKAGESSGHSF